MTVQEIAKRVASRLARGTRVAVGLFLLLVVVMVAGFATGLFGHISGSGSSAAPDRSYRLGQQCAKAGWQTAESAPVGQLDLAQAVDMIDATCKRTARRVGVSDAPRSAFHRGFVKGLAEGPPGGPSASG